MKKVLYIFILLIVEMVCFTRQISACEQDVHQEEKTPNKNFIFQSTHLTLPLELKFLILKFVTHPKDLRDISLVNKHHYEFVNYNYIRDELRKDLNFNSLESLKNYLYSLSIVEPQNDWWIRLELKLAQKN